MELLLEILLFGGLGIAILMLATALSVFISGEVVDNVDFLLQGIPDGLVIYKKCKQDKDKQEPIPVEVIHPGSSF